MVETRNVSWSVVLHGVILFIAAVGLPILLPKKPDPVPLVMSVELLPISEVNNVKPSDQPLQKAQNKATPTPPKPVTPPPAPTPPKAVPTPPAPTPPPTPKTFDPDEGAAVKDKIKPVEKPPEPPKPTVDQKANDEFNKILNKLQTEAKDKPAPVTPAPTAPGKDATTTPANLTKSDQPYNDAIPMSQTETNSIRDQLQVCWSPPIGAKDANKLIVIVHITIAADGTISEPKLDSTQQGRYTTDSFFRAAADGAMRATLNPKCNILKNLPADKYGVWHQTEVTFDPSNM